MRPWHSLYVFASVAKQSIFKELYGLLRRYASRKDGGVWIASTLRFSQRRGRMDCFDATLLAKTGAYGLLRRYASRKDGGVWIASTLRFSQRRGYGLLRRYAFRKDGGVWIASTLRFSQRRGRMDCFVAMLLAKTGACSYIKKISSPISREV